MTPQQAPSVDLASRCAPVVPAGGDRPESILERADEAGLVTPLLVAAVALALILLWHEAGGQAHAAPRVAPPQASPIAGIIVGLLPVGMAVLFMTFAFRRVPARPADDEVYGDTTGLGEQDR